MDKEKFIQQYIVQFMASYAAVNFAEACCRGESDFLHKIVEDAQSLAEDAWEEYCKLKL